MIKGKLLAEGRTAWVYEYGDDKVLKIFKPSFSQRIAQYEFDKALNSEKTGYDIPKVYEILTYEGQLAIVYQRVFGVDLTDRILEKPVSIFKNSKLVARLHYKMHRFYADKLNSQKTHLIKKINNTVHLDENIKKKVIDYLNALPQDNKLCHGDFHLGNIMLTDDGPIIIDWIDASSGHPLADVARTVIVNSSAKIPTGTPNKLFLTIGRKIFLRIYLKLYFKLSQYSRKELDAWFLPVAAAHLSENIHDEKNYLIKLVNKLLS